MRLQTNATIHHAIGIFFLSIFLCSFPVCAEQKAANGDRIISLDLHDTDFDNFLRIISEVSGFNIIEIDPLKKKITKRILDTPWRKILDQVLPEFERQALYEGNVIRIYPVGEKHKAKKYSGRAISLDLQGTDHKNVLGIIEEVSGKKSGATINENCKITMRLITVPWDQVLDIVSEICTRQQKNERGGEDVTSLEENYD